MVQRQKAYRTKPTRTRSTNLPRRFFSVITFKTHDYQNSYTRSSTTEFQKDRKHS